MTLLGAEIMARTGQAPHELYKKLAERHGDSYYGRLDSDLKEGEKEALRTIDAARLVGAACAGRRIAAAYTAAPGNQAPIGGLKVVLDDGSWFAMRPSGTEPKMKLYAESFSGRATWAAMTAEAPGLVFG
ncbi:MAG: phosphoglucomutase, alpha-D-glucose phosphate-specific, partial [Candidatus Adiutrix sp.]|jgi:phosphoglucomutase|nr:phosphoglucomutase, alpha-D-glucose phosphate-specific [Candidatus Adiutrix sp.]